MGKPSCPEIHLYWIRHFEDLPQGAWPVDYGEPFCYACNWASWWERGKDPWDNVAQEHTSAAFVGLERAHVIPQSLQGSDDPSNLALLCNKPLVVGTNSAMLEGSRKGRQLNREGGGGLGGSPDHRKCSQHYREHPDPLEHEAQGIAEGSAKPGTRTDAFGPGTRSLLSITPELRRLQ